MKKNKAYENLQGINPQTGECLPGLFQEATETTVNMACEAAASAALVFSSIVPQERARLIREIANNIMALGDNLISLTEKETGLPRGRLVAERGRTINQLHMFSELLEEGSWVNARIDIADVSREPLPKPDVRSMLRPIGPVAVFGASNFPLAFSVAGGDSVSALAGGNPVVVKAHPAHPGTSALIADAVEKSIESASLPRGIFSLLHGKKPDVSIALACHPAIKAVGFTGSLRVGRALYDAAASRAEPIPVYAEMGSVNPIVVLSDALATRCDSIAQGLSQSMTLGVGQFCTKPGVVLVEGNANVIIDALVAELEPMDAGTMLSASLNENYQKGLDRVQAVKGVKPMFRKSSDIGLGRSQAMASVMTCNHDVFLQHPELSEEVFGPVTLIVNCEDRNAIMQIVNNFPGQLTATVHGTDVDLNNILPLLDALGRIAGRLIINGYPTGVEVCNAMHHGGPYPATTEVHSTSVGTAAIFRYTRPLCYQDFPDEILPKELQNKNPLGIWRFVNGHNTRDPIV